MKWEYLILGLVFFTIVGISFYAGRKSVKPEIIDVSHTDSVLVFTTDTIKQKIYIIKPAKKDTLKIYDTIKTKFSEVIDTTVILGKDSLDFAADIFFDGEKFDNYFDFSLRKFSEKIIQYVEVPARLEIYQEPVVIGLMGLVLFLFGLVL